MAITAKPKAERIVTAKIGIEKIAGTERLVRGSPVMRETPQTAAREAYRTAAARVKNRIFAAKEGRT